MKGRPASIFSGDSNGGALNDPGNVNGVTSLSSSNLSAEKSAEKNAEKSNCGSSYHAAANGIAETSNQGGSSHNPGNANGSANNYYTLCSSSNLANANDPTKKKQLAGSSSNMANANNSVKKKQLAGSSSNTVNAKGSAAAAHAVDTTGLKRHRLDSGETSASVNTNPAGIIGHSDNSNRAAKKQRTVAGPDAAGSSRAIDLNPDLIEQEVSALIQQTSNIMGYNNNSPSQHLYAGVDNNPEFGENVVSGLRHAQPENYGADDEEEQELGYPTSKMFTSEYDDPTEGKWWSNHEVEGPSGYYYTPHSHEQAELQQQPRASFNHTSFNNSIQENDEWDHNYDYHHTQLLDMLDELEDRRGIKRDNVDGANGLDGPYAIAGTGFDHDSPVNINNHSNLNVNSNVNPNVNSNVNNDYNIFGGIDGLIDHYNDNVNDNYCIDPRKLCLVPEREASPDQFAASSIFTESVGGSNFFSAADAAGWDPDDISDDSTYNGFSHQSTALLAAAEERVARPVARSMEIQQREQREDAADYDDEEEDMSDF